MGYIAIASLKVACTDSYREFTELESAHSTSLSDSYARTVSAIMM